MVSVYRPGLREVISLNSESPPTPTPSSPNTDLHPMCRDHLTYNPRPTGKIVSLSEQPNGVLG